MITKTKRQIKETNVEVKAKSNSLVVKKQRICTVMMISEKLVQKLLTFTKFTSQKEAITALGMWYKLLLLVANSRSAAQVKVNICLGLTRTQRLRKKLIQLKKKCSNCVRSNGVRR